MTKTKRANAGGFLVKFINVGGRCLSWEERIPRPVDEVAIVRAVKRKKALASRFIEAPYVDDYGGAIYAGIREVGRYVIVPGSEQPPSTNAVDPHAQPSGTRSTRETSS